MRIVQGKITGRCNLTCPREVIYEPVCAMIPGIVSPRLACTVVNCAHLNSPARGNSIVPEKSSVVQFPKKILKDSHLCEGKSHLCEGEAQICVRGGSGVCVSGSLV